MSSRSQRHSRAIAGKDSADQAWEPGKGGGYGGGNLRVAPVVPGFSTWPAVDDLAVTYTADTTATIDWTAPTDPSDGTTLFGYVLLRDGVEIASANINTFNDTGLVAGQKYVYTIYSFDDSARLSTGASVEYVSAP
jgi:hypothetical protein